MKGSLQYVSKDKTLVKSWVVWYNDTPVGGNISFVDSLPLHPDDCYGAIGFKGKKVEFEMVTEWENGKVGVNGLTYAKLK